MLKPPRLTSLWSLPFRSICEVRYANRTRFPIASEPGNSRAASAAFTTAAGWPSGVSSLLNARPRSTGMPIVEK